MLVSFILLTTLVHTCLAACAAFVQNWTNIKTINNLSIPQLNIRAMPCDDVCLDEWQQKYEDATTELQRENITNWIQASSYSGYMDKTETFLEVVANDWDIVCNRMNTSHIELAAHIRHIMSLRETTTHNIIEYNASSLVGNTLPQRKPQKIQVTREQTNGFQYSMFENIGNTNGFNDRWSCTWNFTNLYNSLSLSDIGATCNSKNGLYDYRGQITWIEELGFYEGHTSYRLDPVVLYSMIVG